ncbi:GTPase/DUF3482 domain-containing protein [Aliidiomarina sp. Khilg15.8]
MSKQNLDIAVVGHTNVGKTSLLRTLLRDPDFGEVASQPSTTRHVARAMLQSVHGDKLALYDTPGLEDGIGLYEYLEQLQGSTTRHDGPALLQLFLESPEASHSFAQEAKVIRQLGNCDAAFYVIDARDPVLPKFQDELSILTKAGKPLLPVLNFTASSDAKSQAWQEALARVNLHAWVEFDSVAPQQDGERQVFRQLQALLPAQQALLQNFIDTHVQLRQQQRDAAFHQVADMLVDCAAFRLRVERDDDDDVQQAIEALQEQLRQRERACVACLLRLFHFRADDASFDAIPLSQGRWEDDLFNPQTLRQFGIQAGTGAAAGAVAGAGVDVLFAGTTLGAGTLIGATVGGVWQSWQRYGQRLRDKVRGYHELTAEDGIIELLARRQLQLIEVLQKRGHAATEQAHIEVAMPQTKSLSLRTARAYPQWSALSKAQFADTQERQRYVTQLSSQLAALKPVDK